MLASGSLQAASFERFLVLGFAVVILCTVSAICGLTDSFLAERAIFPGVRRIAHRESKLCLVVIVRAIILQPIEALHRHRSAVLTQQRTTSTIPGPHTDARGSMLPFETAKDPSCNASQNPNGIRVCYACVYQHRWIFRKTYWNGS